MKTGFKFAVIILPLFIFSCMEGSSSYPIAEIDNYSALAVGNYWIYDKYAIDTLGNEYSLGSLDSVYIEKDTTINGYTYYKMIEPAVNVTSPYLLAYPQVILYIRDSSHYIVTSDHKRIFSSVDFGTTFYTEYHVGPDTHYVATHGMTDQDLSYTVPAGTFITSTFQKMVYPFPNWASLIGGPLAFNVRYAQNVGIVTKHLRLPYGQSTQIERRLVRFHIN